MNFSTITENLLIGTTPSQTDYDTLRNLGVRLIINMRFGKSIPADENPSPLQILWLRTHDNLFLPIPIAKLAEGVQHALPVIHSGGKVYVHCAYGRHRSVAMGACILIAQGSSVSAAMDLIKRKRSVADPRVFYIRWRIEKFANQWAVQETERLSF